MKYLKKPYLYILTIVLFVMWNEFHWLVQIFHSQRVADAIGDVIITMLVGVGFIVEDVFKFLRFLIDKKIKEKEDYEKH
jgi:hypothetical protein